jgi:hypothetical protein
LGKFSFDCNTWLKLWWALINKIASSRHKNKMFTGKRNNRGDGLYTINGIQKNDKQSYKEHKYNMKTVKENVSLYIHDQVAETL